MTASVVQFLTPAEHALEIEERLVDLVDHLGEIGQRLDNLEAMAVAAGSDPLAAILSRLAAFENRLARVELRQRRPMPLTVIENHRLDPDQQAQFNELQRLFNRLDRDLAQRATTSDARAAHFSSQFRKIRERLTAIETRTT